MLKTFASIVACTAVLGLVAPVQAGVSSTDTAVVSLCDGEKKEKKEVEKPAESVSPVAMCDGDKKKDKDAEKPAE